MLALAVHAIAVLPLLWIRVPLSGLRIESVLPVELVRMPLPGPAVPAETEPAPVPQDVGPQRPAPVEAPPPPVPRRRPPARALAQAAAAPAAQPDPPDRAKPQPVATASPEIPSPAAVESGVSALASPPLLRASAVARERPERPASPVQPRARSALDWKSYLVGRLKQYKRYPRAAQEQHLQGTSYVRFVMDRRGRVVTARLEISSGHGVLDEEALSLPRRSEPLPTPPAGVGGERIEVVVPVEFSLR